MNTFLRGSAHLGASLPSPNFSALHTRSGQFSANASFENSSSVLLQSGSASPPAPSPHAAEAASGDGDISAAAAPAASVESLTMTAVKRFVRQLRQLEGRSSAFAATAVSTGGGGGGGPGVPEPPSTTEQTSAQDAGEETDSEDLDVYTARTERQVRAFLGEVESEGGAHAPEPVPEAEVDVSEADERRHQRERLRGLSSDELRAVVLELHAELISTLYDAVTLETNLTETDEDAAVLERAVGEREEKLAMLKMQLSTVEDYNEELHDAKKEALRKLSEAKTEMALLSQRNAKLLRQLDMKEEELQMSLTTSLNGSQRPSLAAGERRDAGTLTETVVVVPPSHRSSQDAIVSFSSPAVLVDESLLSVSGRSKSAEAHQEELEETQEELRLARKTLYDVEMARIKLQEQLQELKEATMTNFEADGAAARRGSRVVEQDADAADVEMELRTMKERCLRSEEHAVALESELRQLRTELHVTQGRVEAHEHAAAAAAAELKDDIRVAPSSGAATPIRSSSSPPRPCESRGSSADPTAATNTATSSAAVDAVAGARLSLSQPRSVSMEAQMVVLQRQLARAQAESTRLEQELRKEREKTQRQAQAERKLLENVAYLTRQLRAREALEREARSIRRSEVNTARAEVSRGERSASGSEAPRTAHPASEEDALHAAEKSEDGQGERWRRREQRHATPELRRRRESVFAALRDAQRQSEDRRVGALDANNLSIASSTHEATTSLPPPPPPREAERSQPIASAEEPKVVLAKRSAPAADTSAAAPAAAAPLALTSSTASASAAAAAAAAAASRTSSTAGPTAASLEHPSISVSSFRMGRLSAASLVSPRGPHNASLDSMRRDAVAADCVRLDTNSATPAVVTAAAIAGVAAKSSVPESPQRQALRKPLVALPGGDGVGGGGRRGAEGGAEQPAMTLAPAAAAAAAAVTARPAPPPPLSSSEPTLYVLPDALTSSQDQLQRQHVVRGLSSVRAASSPRLAGTRSSSAGATVHRSSPSLAAPAAASTTVTVTAVSSNSAAMNASSTTTRSAPIARGLAATVGGGSGLGAPLAAPRKRTASRRIVTSRDARLSSTREGSTPILR